MNNTMMAVLLIAPLVVCPLAAGAQTIPPPNGPTAEPAGKMPGPVPEEQPAPKAQPQSKQAQKKRGHETGWGGQQKTEEEQKSESKRNETQGQPPR